MLPNTRLGGTSHPSPKSWAEFARPENGVRACKFRPLALLLSRMTLCSLFQFLTKQDTSGEVSQDAIRSCARYSPGGSPISREKARLNAASEV